MVELSHKSLVRNSCIYKSSDSLIKTRGPDFFCLHIINRLTMWAVSLDMLLFELVPSVTVSPGSWREVNKSETFITENYLFSRGSRSDLFLFLKYNVYFYTKILVLFRRTINYSIAPVNMVPDRRQ